MGNRVGPSVGGRFVVVNTRTERVVDVCEDQSVAREVAEWFSRVMQIPCEARPVAGICPYCNGTRGPHDEVGGLVGGVCPECGWRGYDPDRAPEGEDCSGIVLPPCGAVDATGNIYRCGSCEVCCYGQA